jgi:probable DNA metabolism protein
MFDRAMTFEEWRDRARPLLGAGVEPGIACRVITDGVDAAAAPRTTTLPTTTTTAPTPAPSAVAATTRRLPAALMRLLESISCFRAAGRHELMYRLAWRTLFENPKLLEDAADPDVRNATLMDAAIRRDVHKMHAFVRFREVAAGDGDGESAYFAWFEPEHDILRRGSAFFVKRFPNMTWTIATPEGAAVWNKVGLVFADPPSPEARPDGDRHENLWRTYYRSICNAARINPQAMQREMPQKYWRNLPEAADIQTLIRAAGVSAADDRGLQERTAARLAAMKRSLADLSATGSSATGPGPGPAEGPHDCRRCELWRRATQAVAGSGPDDARVMLVGEQPGDEEDLRGTAFVGPAGRVLDRALAEAGLERAQLYVTNAVKHFKWEPRGRRRLHKRPEVREVSACSVWLEREIAEIRPSVIVALGATALRALAGSTSSIAAARGQTLSHASGARIVATYHPSSILRAEGERAGELRDALVADLTRAGALPGDTL